MATSFLPSLVDIVNVVSSTAFFPVCSSETTADWIFARHHIAWKGRPAFRIYERSFLCSHIRAFVQDLVRQRDESHPLQLPLKADRAILEDCCDETMPKKVMMIV